jgi:histone H3/H4
MTPVALASPKLMTSKCVYLWSQPEGLPHTHTLTHSTPMAATTVITPLAVPVPSQSSIGSATAQSVIGTNPARARHTDPTSFKAKLHKLAEVVNPHMRISAKAVDVLNDFLALLVQKVVDSADVVATYAEVKTLSYKEIKAAVSIVYPEELRAEAIESATAALRRYDPEFDKKRPRGPASPAATPALAPAADPSPAPAPAPAPVEAEGSARRRKPVSRATQAGLQLSPARVENLIRECTKTERISETAPVYLAAALEWLAALMWKLAGDRTTNDGMVTIMDRHLGRVVEEDPALKRFVNWLAPVDDEIPSPSASPSPSSSPAAQP